MNRREFFNLIPIPFLSKLIPDKKIELIDKQWYSDLNTIPLTEVLTNCNTWEIFFDIDYHNNIIDGSFVSRTHKINMKILENITRPFEAILDFNGKMGKAIVFLTILKTKYLIDTSIFDIKFTGIIVEPTKLIISKGLSFNHLYIK